MPTTTKAAVTNAPVKACVYCGGPNPRRARTCSDGHERRVRAQLSSATGRRNRALRAAMDAMHDRERNRSRWRDVALGRANAAAQLALIFTPTRKRRARA